MPKRSTRSTAGAAAEAAKIVKAHAAAARPEKGSDAHLLQTTSDIIELLIEVGDPYLISRILATVETFFPSKVRVEPSRNVEGMS